MKFVFLSNKSKRLLYNVKPVQWCEESQEWYAARLVR